MNSAEYHKQWRIDNAEQQREYGRLYAQQYRAKNLEKVRAYKRKWRAANREKDLAARRARYMHVSGKLKLRLKAWKKKNMSKVLDLNTQRRARYLSAVAEDCSKKIELLRLLPVCQYCFTLINGVPTIDHVVPLTRGGKHIPGNLTACCGSCNSSKGDKLLSEWSGRLLKEAA